MPNPREEMLERPQMATSSPFKPWQQEQFFLVTLCKCPSTPSPFKFQYASYVSYFSPSKHAFQRLRFSPPTRVRAHVSHLETKMRSVDQELSTDGEFDSGFSSFWPKHKKSVNHVSSVGKEHMGNKGSRDIGKVMNNLGSPRRREMGANSHSVRSRNEKLAKSASKTSRSIVVSGKMGKISDKGDNAQLKVGKLEKGSKKSKVDSRETMLRVGLDMCSKRGDVLGAIGLYDLARREGIEMGQYHYAVLLYLCSSAAMGVVQPAKSGNTTRSLNAADSLNKFYGVGSEDLDGLENLSIRNSGRNYSGMLVKCSEFHEYSDEQKTGVNDLRVEVAKCNSHSSINGKENSMLLSNLSVEQRPQTLDGLIQLMKGDDYSSNVKEVNGDLQDNGVQVSEDVKKYALQRGFEIYEEMCLENIPMNEATLTSVARMAMSMGNGDMAFNMIEQMKALGINPRLRSYGPALTVFCNSGDTEKAFYVEEHMLEHGVYPEEPELAALLRVSIEAGRSDKVYYLLQRIRESVRQVSTSTANLIENWFKTRVAQRVGKGKYDPRLILEAMNNGGGGWHGQGWLGRGKWTISHTSVGADGLCNCCGEKLATIDLDPTETEKFAESVASIASKREKNSSFLKFQKWLDYYGPFEAVVDGANVGLFSQKRFKPSKINAVANGMRQMLPSKKWPLIVLHNRRIIGDKMDEPINKVLIEKWKNADALYATPTGSNDDWYWLYAAIKFKCLIVTNDEMKDHLFQLLGNDFFPKWKERHQVRFSFSEVGPVLHMPPPYSVVIQESKEGHWHIPVVSEQASEGQRLWLCITRAKSETVRQGFATTDGEFRHRHKKGLARSDTQTGTEANLSQLRHDNHESRKHPRQELYRNLRNILSSSVFPNHCTILPDIEAAEKLGGCVIDFQI